MAILYSDTFSSRTPNAFWNDSQGVTFTGTNVSVAAGGNWLGAEGLAVSPGLFREVVWQVTGGDRPGCKLYNQASDEIVSLTFITSRGTLRYSVDGGSYSSVAYNSFHQWRRVRMRASGITISTSSNGTSWTDVITLRTSPFPDYLAAVYFNSAGGGIGDGTSTTATVVDNFTWQDYTPAAMALTTSAVDDCQRADENPLSNSGLWITPGIPDHDTMKLESRAILGTNWQGAALDRNSISGRVEVWARIGGTARPRTEYTLFAHATSGRWLGYDVWIVGTEIWVSYFTEPISRNDVVEGAAVPGGALAVGDVIGLIVESPIVTFVLQRRGGSAIPIAEISDSHYRSGLIGIALIDNDRANPGAYSAVGGGAR